METSLSEKRNRLQKVLSIVWDKLRMFRASALGEASSIKKPRYCCWVINYRCMLRCKMCHIWNLDYDFKLATSMEEKKRFVRSLRNLVEPGFEFHLSGGEPLMEEGIFELIKFISDEGYKTNLVTNGFLVNKEIAKRILESGLGTLTFSLDGVCATTHDFLRGVAGSYEKIMQAIACLDDFDGRKLKIAILTTIMERNIDELLELVQRVQSDKRLEMISFQAVTQPFCEENDNIWFLKEKNKYLWPQDIAKAALVMDKLKELKQKGYRIGNKPDHFMHFKEYFSNPNMFLKKIKCNLGDYEFHVDPYGKVFFCCLMDPIGNIKNGYIPKIWNSPEANRIRQGIYNCRKNCHIMVNCFYEDEPRA